MLTAVFQGSARHDWQSTKVSDACQNVIREGEMEKETQIGVTLSDLYEVAAGGLDTVALVLIRTKAGKGSYVAQEASRLAPSVHWTAMVWGTEHTVIAAVRVPDKSALDGVMEQIRAIDGVKNPSKAQVVGERYVDGARIDHDAPHNSWP